MKMIIGGAFQGKERYAKEHFPNINWKNGKDTSVEELLYCDGILGFHEFIRKEMRNEQDISVLAEEIIKNNPNIIIVSNEVGYGVVPMDKFERIYREQVGRICTKLAGASDEVIRVVCGIGTVIKGA